MLRTAAGAAGYALLSGCHGGDNGSGGVQTQEWPPSLPVGTFSPSAADNAFLDAIVQQGCLFFWEQANPNNGQVLDHARNNLGGAFDTSTTESSIAATGFGLTALCIADSRGYQPHAQILERVQATLNFHLNQMPEKNGFLYHFNDVNTGQPLPNSGVSCMDMAIFLCGVLMAGAWLGDPTVASLADQLYQRVNWPWMLNGANTFAQAWDPQSGFTVARYDTYCELMMLYLLAMASPNDPISPACWNSFARPQMQYEGYRYITNASDPLFVHQYSHAWFDFRNKKDAYADYFQNSIAATQAHETFCLAYPSVNGAWYSKDYWGITSSDYVNGYVEWGGPPALGPIDGTVVPCAATGSLVFLPNQCLAMLEALKTNWGAAGAWGRYGFVDAFHPSANWYCPWVLGIDQGISVLMAENLRTGMVWKTFMGIPACVQAMQLAGFQ